MSVQPRFLDLNNDFVKFERVPRRASQALAKLHAAIWLFE